LTSLTTAISSQRQLCPDEDDFWKDCIDSESTTSTNGRKLGTQDLIYLTFNDEQKKNTVKPQKVTNHAISEPLKTYGNNPKFVEEKFKQLSTKLQLDTFENNQLKTSSSPRKNISVERCLQLYEKSKVKMEVNKMVIQKNIELKEKRMMSTCTFKPKTNITKSLKNSPSRKPHHTSVFERNDFWLRNKKEKLEKTMNEKKNNKNHHQPKLNRKDMKQVYNPENTILNDFTARSYLIRQEKARINAKEKSERQHYHIKNNDFRKYKRICSASADNSVVYDEADHIQTSIKHLHNELHSITYENNNE